MERSGPPRRVLWTTPERLGTWINVDEQTYEPALSSDGEELYFTRGRPGGNADLFVAKRRGGEWTDIIPLEAVNSIDDDIGACLTPSGERLYFYSNRPGGQGGYDIWVSERDSKGQWQAPVNLGPAVNSGANEYDPSISPDGDTMLFSSNRTDEPRPKGDAWAGTLRAETGQDNYDVFVADISGEKTSKAEPLEAVNTPANEGQPMISKAGDFLYFASDRPGGHGGYDIWRVRIRGRGLEELSPAENLGLHVNSPANELDPSVTPEGFAMYFSSDGNVAGEKYDIYYAESRDVYVTDTAIKRVAKKETLPKRRIYAARTPEKRKEVVEEMGGTVQTEEAVEKALDWLVKAQSADGRWDVDGFPQAGAAGGAGGATNGDVAVTGLTTLAFLGAGYTHTVGKHKETVGKALDWLIAGQKANGDLRRGGQMYGQGIATAALCEAYTLTRDGRALAAAKKAVKFILEAQNPGLGWRYNPRSGDSDTSVVGWQVLALKSAEIAGIEIPPQHYKWAQAWLDEVRKGENGGLYSYQAGSPLSPTMTAEGWFCQIFMSEGQRTRGMAESIKYLVANLPKGSARNLYYWYYATLAMRLSEVKEFEKWNVALRDALTETQLKDGPGAGTWDPAGSWGPRGGRVYTTAMATLCLEVYYRYLPFYKTKTK
jgi:hypothetical protein